MSHADLYRFLLACLAVNYGVLMLWFLIFVFARDWILMLHRKFFDVSDRVFDAVHYAGMGIYKLGILLLNVAPLAALYFLQSRT